jgi:hypothetical protein
MNQQIVLQKVVDEVVHGSGLGITPEPEELEGMREIRPEVKPSSNIVCVKPIRKRYPNPTFHRYSPELWSIEAMRVSTCGLCRGQIHVREEITLFDGVATWAHFSHAVDEPEKQ